MVSSTVTLKCNHCSDSFFLTFTLSLALYLLYLSTLLSPHPSCIPGCAGAAGVGIATGAGAGAGAASVKMDRNNITTLHYKETHIPVSNLEIERKLLLTLCIKTISKIDRCTCLDTCCCHSCSGHSLLLFFQKSILSGAGNDIPYR